jgi:hypothetical protein
MRAVPNDTILIFHISIYLGAPVCDIYRDVNLERGATLSFGCTGACCCFVRCLSSMPGLVIICLMSCRPDPGRFRFAILFPEKKDYFQFINVLL